MLSCIIRTNRELYVSEANHRTADYCKAKIFTLSEAAVWIKNHLAQCEIEVERNRCAETDIEIMLVED